MGGARFQYQPVSICGAHHSFVFEATTLAIAGPYAVPMEGGLTTYCVTSHIQVPASVRLKGGQLLALTTGAHNIEIPLLGSNTTTKAGCARETLTGVNAVSKSRYGLVES